MFCLPGLSFKGVTLFHLYRDKKVAEQRIAIVPLEVYENTVTRLEKDSSTKVSVPTSHISTPFSIKEA